jgi:hypothetical protein
MFSIFEDLCDCLSWRLSSVNLSVRQRWAGIAQSVQQLATDWTVWGLSPGRCDIFRTPPDRPWGLPSLLYNPYRVFPGGIAAGAWH